MASNVDLPTPEPAKSEPLALAGRQQPVESAHTGRDGGRDAGPPERVRRRPGDDPVLRAQRALAVERPPETIEHATQHGGPDRNTKLLLAEPDRGARSHARQIAERNQGDHAVLETDDLGADHALGLEVDPADRSQLENQTGGLHGGPDDPHHFTRGLEPRRGLGGFE
jgi:hypothetical protein